MNKENLSGRVEKDLLEKVRKKFPGANKTESYRAAFLAALDCNTREHVSTVGLEESVTQRLEALEEKCNTVGHTSPKGLGDIVTQTEVIQILDVREKALTQEIDKLKEGMRVLNDNLKKVSSSASPKEAHETTPSNVEERLNELQHNIDTLSGLILNV